jgi:1-deoxy-D-xylulose-5-phosphate synthase
MNEQELRNLMYTAQLPEVGPFSIRYPRGQGVMPVWKAPFEKIEIGKGRLIQEGEDIAILTLGHIGNYAIEARKMLAEDELFPAHYDMRFVKPLDEELLHKIFRKFGKVITVEDGCLMGGFGSAILEFMVDHQYTSKVIRLGIPDRLIEHGEQPELYKECGYDTEGIAKAVRSLAGLALKK